MGLRNIAVQLGNFIQFALGFIVFSIGPKGEPHDAHDQTAQKQIFHEALRCGSCGTPRLRGSTGNAGASVRRPMRNLADRARGLAPSSSFEALIALRLCMVNCAGTSSTNGAYRLPACVPARAWKNRFTMRSSTE